MTPQQSLLEIGLFTFGEITADPATGRALEAVRLQEFIDHGVRGPCCPGSGRRSCRRADDRQP
jgi:hypothetical protein